MPILFQAASLSKQFAGACVLALADAGILDPREPIGRHVPEAAPQWRGVTLHELLTQTSGMAHWDGEGPAFDPYGDLGTEARIDSFLRSERRSPAWHYSSPGYMVVGRVVERAAGAPYAEVLSERLLVPLGLAHTMAGVPAGAADVVELATGHRDGEPVAWTAGPWIGTNDLWTTEADLKTWTRALHTGPYAARAAYPHVELPPDPDWLSGAAYGYGLYTGTAGGRPAVFHEGDVPGFRTVVVWLADEGRAVAVLADEEKTDVIAEVRARIEAG